MESFLLRPWVEIVFGAVGLIAFPLYSRFVVPIMVRRSGDRLLGLRRAWRLLMLWMGTGSSLLLLGVGIYRLISN
jgi:hypothetical protein